MPAIYVLLKRLAELLGMKKVQSGASWTWKSVRSHSKKYRNMHDTTLDVETVPMDAMLTINTKVSKDDEDKHTMGLYGQNEEIGLSKL